LEKNLLICYTKVDDVQLIRIRTLQLGLFLFRPASKIIIYQPFSIISAEIIQVTKIVQMPFVHLTGFAILYIGNIFG